MRKRIAAIKPLQRALEEELVNAAVMGTPEWQAARTVLLYKHKGKEFSVNNLGNAAFRTGKRVVFPRVEEGRLVLHAVDAWTGLSPGAFGVDEPSVDAPVVAPSEVEVAVVPGLAWTAEGHRMGQGGGFYDRLLPEVEGVTFGVGFDVQLLDSLPLDPHDVPVERVFWADSVVQT